MTFSLADGRRVHLIGDPHLGKVFPALPSRRGERELLQFTHYQTELDADADIIVEVGDLFDNPNVSKEVVVATANAMLSAAERNEDVTYVAMCGNHDQPRSLGTVGAWIIFKKMVEDRLPNLILVDRPLAWEGLAFFPWEWNRRADIQVVDLMGARVEHAIGHWDLSVFDDKDDHLAPVAALRAAFGDTVGLWSGHYHIPGDYDGVTCIGSMQPYSHGEDPEQRHYVTLTRSEALSRTDLRNKAVRVILAPGEDMPDIDCLALTHKREREDEVIEELTVSLDDFDFHKIVAERIRDRDPRVRSFIEERMSLNVAPEEQR